MKKLLLFLLLCTGIANAQVINFTDANLKAALLAPTNAKDLLGNPITTVDANSDGDIDVSEAQDILELDISGAGITDFSGIENFNAMKQFSCLNNLMIDLDLTGLTAVEVVNCSGNANLGIIYASGLQHVYNIDYTNNPNLANLDISDCPLMGVVNITENTFSALDISNSGVMGININSTSFSAIDFTGCNSLTNIVIWNSQLPTISFQNLPGLTQITLSGNLLLSNINVTNCPNLNYLYCNESNLSSLDFTNMQGLQYLFCSDNHFTTLDVSSLTHLIQLACMNNQLQSLYMKNGQNESLAVAGNPALTFICADESQIGAVQTVLNAAAMTTTVCNSYCNFTPGGPFNTILGSMKLDSNNDGCDAADVSPINMRVNINDGTTTNTAFVNTNGAYRLYTQAGNFSITPSVENPSYFNFSPATDSAVFPDNLFNTAIKNFCVTSVGSHQDLEVVITPIASARPGFDATYRIVYKNKGNEPISAANGIAFAYNDNLLDFVSASTAATTSGVGSLVWDYSNLLPFESRSILVTLHVHAPTDAVPVNVGDVLQFTSAILPTAADENNADNTFLFNQTVIGSYDPNSIACIEGDVVSPTEIGDYLHYIINFENTGTDAAENIVVKTVIDPLQFDLNSLQLMNASNEVEARITGNIVEFIFENIQLGIGGHGHILLKIKTNNALVSGDTVSKKADIFFDYNFPVDTGAADTTFALLKVQDFETDASIGLQPNPTNGMLAIKANNTIKNVQVYDVQGRLLESHIENNTQSKLDISTYPKGIYFVKVFTQKGVKTEKVIRK
jgi:uncharacterized repeat protein (TIGR01451 family)